MYVCVCVCMYVCVCVCVCVCAPVCRVAVNCRRTMLDITVSSNILLPP